ncbi:MAG: hypothetical protein ACYC91_08025 [Solirubrobacteraceae bacterium]
MSRRRPRPSSIALSLLALVAIGAIAALIVRSDSGPAVHPVESIAQDDQLLLYSPTATVVRTLRTLRGLGVDRLRLTVVWRYLAPDSSSSRRPPGFHASDPAAYPPSGWVPYDRIVVLARLYDLGVDFNVTAPGPLWAMAAGAPNRRVADHYRPAAWAFGQFLTALGRRYSGSYIPPGARVHRALPRVSFWTIWNEPNQPGWLSPQRRRVAGRTVPDAPRLYREYVDAGFAALRRTGHAPGRDTILIGELAPEGSEQTGAQMPLPPMTFLRALYCVDARDRPLRGTPAAALQCAYKGGTDSFVRAHPGLFAATGFAHHPYSFFLAPTASLADRNFVPLSDLGRLEHALDRIFATYGVSRQLPIYLTEYGYATNPPNPFRDVTPAEQSLYLNEAQYLAWEDPRVRALAQFLLVDAAPDPSYRPGSIGYWSTFQTGLVFLDGVPKPALNSYRLPIVVPDPVVSPGGSMLLWAMLRPASNGTLQHAEVQWRAPHGSYRPIARFSTRDPTGTIELRVKLPSSGAVRIAWSAPGGAVFHSRSVGVTVR